MGKGHFTCLGCNGYFAAGHWGGDGAAVPPTGGGGGGRRYYKPRVVVQPRKLSPQVLRLIKEWLELELDS
jgi:hypothetical protein